MTRLLPRLSPLFLFPVFAFAADHVALLGTYTQGESHGIYAVRLNAETGALSNPELVAELSNPEFLALAPDGKEIFALTQTKLGDGKVAGTVAAFRVDPTSGHLTALNAEPAAHGSLTHLAVSPSSHTLVAASYGGGYVASFPIASDGHVGVCASVLRETGPLGPNADRQEAPHPHSVSISADSRFALVADLGVDRIFIYRIDDELGTLTPNNPAYAATVAGAGPRHTKFSPDGKFFYALDELNNTITGFRFDSARGALAKLQEISTLPASFPDKNTASEIRIHPSGRFVYAANRGHDSLAVFARDEKTGFLHLVEIVPTGGETPRNFSLSPDGNWLLCAHQTSGNLTVFRVHPDSGQLTAVPASARVSKAVCVLFLN